MSEQAQATFAEQLYQAAAASTITDEELEAERNELRREVNALDAGGYAQTDDERTVHRYLRRRAQVAAEITHVKDQTAALIRSLESKLAGLDYVFGGFAEQYTRAALAGKRERSIRTPFGTLGFRHAPARLEVVDEAAVIAAARDLELPPDTIRVKTEVSKTALAALWKSTGEVPPGCDVTEEKDSFYVK